jgi:rod shape-determining protein MreC
MPLGTLDRTPPPFFRQGPSALTKLLFFSALAVFLMVADARFRMTEPLRAALATALLPVQRTLLAPVQMLQRGGQYLGGLAAALEGERAARAEGTLLAERAARAESLALENALLRSLMDLQPALEVRSLAAEVMFEARDPFSRKVFIDRGAAQGVLAGAPVIDAAGVLGQVTRVFPLSAEVTLLTDKDAAIPVLNARTQQRSVAFGGAGGDGLELRFVAGHADVEAGDPLTTSGVDGVYPPGLAVARVASVERRADGGFARIRLVPAAPADGVRHVLVLEPLSAQRPPPAPEAPAQPRGREGRP